jgi:delta 1-pyrroline-5-carboxylate dehydrogenase
MEFSCTYHHGIFLYISPWNFPLAIFIGPVAAGNTVLAKPAEQTPIISYEAVKILWFSKTIFVDEASNCNNY